MEKNSLPVKQYSDSSCIEVSKRQKGNPLLQYIRNVKWTYNDKIVADYQMSYKICALYLSARYHKLNRAYIHGRIAMLNNNYQCRILLLHIDDGNNCIDDILIELNKICCINGFVLICSWSYIESARYIESYFYYRYKSVDCLMSSSYKQYINNKNKKNKDPNVIQRQNISDILTQIISVNKTNVSTVMNHYGSISALSNCTKDELVSLPGIGNKKAKFIFNAFNKPFKTEK
eukprot:159611_1